MILACTVNLIAHAKYGCAGGRLILCFPMFCDHLLLLDTFQACKLTFSSKVFMKIHQKSDQHLLNIGVRYCMPWSVPFQYRDDDIDGLVQERCNSSALAMELHFSGIKPSIY